MTKALLKDTFRAIGKNLSRYISILLIIALGTCFFVGVKATAPDMFTAASSYFNTCNLMDIRIQSSIGLTDDDVKAIASVEGIEFVKGQKFTDALVLVNGKPETDIDGTQISTRAYGFNPQDIANYLNGVNDGTYINRLQLLSGRYPTAANECLVDESELSTPDSYKIGNTITLTGENTSEVSGLSITEFTIVGVIRTPYYLSYERGNTTIGSGKIGTFIYIPNDAFTLDYYSEVYATVAGASLIDTYSDEYKDLVLAVKDKVSGIADTQIKTRLSTLKPDLEKQIVDAQTKIENSSGEAKDALIEIDGKIEQLENLVNNGAQLVEQAQAQFDSQFANATDEYNSNSEAYNAAIREYSVKRLEYEAKNAEYLEKSNELTAAQKAYDNVYSQWQSANTQIDQALQTISQTQSLITAGETILDQIVDSQTNAYSNEQIQAIINMMQTTYPDLYNSVKALTTSGLAGEIASNLRPFIDQQKTLLAQQESILKQRREQVASLETSLDEYQKSLDEAANELTQAKLQLNKAETDLNEYYTQLVNGGYQLQTGELELQIAKMTAESELNTLKDNVATAPSNLAIAKAKREEIVSKLDSGLLEAENKLQDAKSLYAKLDSTSWSVYTRSDTPGFSGFEQSVKNIDVLANIFPIFFFIISSLVCLITMTRMIEEDRTLVGTYKALGYSSVSVILKYVVYALSACILGSLIGIAVGVYVFPYSIDYAYSIMYTLPVINYDIPRDMCIVGFVISLACTCIATAVALIREMTLNPSKLMRPKAPKPGKRVFLEKLGFIWKKMNFSAKVTARNLARNKSRSIMTIMGIAGCSALLLASLGMYDSLNAITTKQYKEDPVSLSDFQVMFSEKQTAESYEFSKVKDDTRVSDAMLFSMKSVTGTSENTDESIDVYLFVPISTVQLNTFTDLRDRKSGEKFTLDDSGVIITEKLAQVADISVGDEVQVCDSENKTYSFKVSAISENYVFSYVYCSPALYEKVTENEPVFNYAMGKIISSYKEQESTFSSTKGLLTNDFTKVDGIAGISFTDETTEQITRIADALSFVILIFFITSLILAFVILYNLSNINIIERTRELATLKVLGFVDGEVRTYIYSEAVINSLIGIVFGLVLGFGLHKILIAFTAIDTVMYGQDITLSSYLMATGISVMIILFVSLVLNRKIRKIDMISSLKSVE